MSTNDIQLRITIWMNPVALWGWLVPAPKSGLWNILEFSKLILKSLVAWNQPWWECLYHWNWQTLQTEPFFLFLFLRANLPAHCWMDLTDAELKWPDRKEDTLIPRIRSSRADTAAYRNRGQGGGRSEVWWEHQACWSCSVSWSWRWLYEHAQPVKFTCDGEFFTDTAS